MGKQYIDYEVYLVNVDAEKCDGCEKCIIYCPVDVFDFSVKAYPNRPQNCLGCRTCEAVCKSKAVILPRYKQGMVLEHWSIGVLKPF